MKFKVYGFAKSGYSVSLVGSGTPVNIPQTEGYDYLKEKVFDSLSSAKKYMRELIRDAKLSANERSYRMFEISQLKIEDIVDDLLIENSEMEKAIDELKATIKSLKEDENEM